MSVAFTRKESAETAAEVELPDRPISPHANLVTASGLEALANAMAKYRAAYDVAHQIEDATERRRAVALASREMRYFADRLRTAEVIPPPIDWRAQEARLNAFPSSESPICTSCMFLARDPTPFLCC
jgi:predicted hotdog family 3-hydroxylacyl-ACP dehydratase